MSKQPAPTASAVGPCPTIIQIVGRPGPGSLPRTIPPPDQPPLQKENKYMYWIVKHFSIVNSGATDMKVHTHIYHINPMKHWWGWGALCFMKGGII